jgi:hypothetical protein
VFCFTKEEETDLSCAGVIQAWDYSGLAIVDSGGSIATSLYRACRRFFEWRAKEGITQPCALAMKAALRSASRLPELAIIGDDQFTNDGRSPLSLKKLLKHLD